MTNLAQLIDEFAKENAHLAHGDRAWAQCDASTWKFISFAKARGYDGELKSYEFYADYADEIRYQKDETESNQTNPDPAVYIVYDEHRNVLKNDAGIQMCTWHCIVDAGHILIDFTARQYRQHYAFPHIIAIEDKLMTTRNRAMAAGVGL